MKYGPNFAGVAALIGDPARANMLSALMHGAALTATELALEAGVTKQTASSHLARLREAKLLAIEKQGRHSYYRLADKDVAALLESLMGVAARLAPIRTRPGPKEPALRRARVCYDHLAGDLGVAVFDALVGEKRIAQKREEVTLTPRGERFFGELGLSLPSQQGARPLCRACLDWSVRRHHLGGALGAALLTHIFDTGWAKRARGSRVVEFSLAGEKALKKTFALS